MYQENQELHRIKSPHSHSRLRDALLVALGILLAPTLAVALTAPHTFQAGEALTSQTFNSIFADVYAALTSQDQRISQNAAQVSSLWSNLPDPITWECQILSRADYSESTLTCPATYQAISGNCSANNNVVVTGSTPLLDGHRCNCTNITGGSNCYVTAHLKCCR